MHVKRHTHKSWDIPFEQVHLFFRDIHLYTQFLDIYKFLEATHRLYDI